MNTKKLKKWKSARALLWAWVQVVFLNSRTAWLHFPQMTAGTHDARVARKEEKDQTCAAPSTLLAQWEQAFVRHTDEPSRASQHWCTWLTGSRPYSAQEQCYAEANALRNSIGLRLGWRNSPSLGAPADHSRDNPRHRQGGPPAASHPQQATRPDAEGQPATATGDFNRDTDSRWVRCVPPPSIKLLVLIKPACEIRVFETSRSLWNLVKIIP